MTGCMYLRLIVVFYLQLLGDVEVLALVVIDIDDAHAPIFGHLQRVQHIPERTSVVVGPTVEDDAVVYPVELVVAAADAVVVAEQQVLVLVNHPKAEVSVARYDEFWLFQIIISQTVSSRATKRQ